MGWDDDAPMDAEAEGQGSVEQRVVLCGPYPGQRMSKVGDPSVDVEPFDRRSRVWGGRSVRPVTDGDLSLPGCALLLSEYVS